MQVFVIDSTLTEIVGPQTKAKVINLGPGRVWIGGADVNPIANNGYQLLIGMETELDNSAYSNAVKATAMPNSTSIVQVFPT